MLTLELPILIPQKSIPLGNVTPRLLLILIVFSLLKYTVTILGLLKLLTPLVGEAYEN